MLQCSVCLGENLNPRLLSCQHSFCLTCLQSLADRSRGNRIQCPQCRKVTILPERGVEVLQADFRLNQMRDYVTAVSKKRKLCESDHPKGKPAKKHCHQCNSDFCEPCAEIHTQRKLFVDHKLAPITVISCNKHEKNFIYFCESCSRLLCQICIQVGTCKDHMDGDKAKEINAIKDEKKAELITVMNQIIKCMDSYANHHKPMTDKVIELLRTAVCA